ncbi:MAG: proton-conducting transporter membrane subunit [Pirellulaceae bacterium]|nr:oxidoreductase [Planctomycetales bacterium]
MEINAIVNALGICVVVCPVALVAVLGLTSLIGWPLSEQSIVRFIHVTGLTGFAASLSMLAIMLATDHRIEVITVGNLVNIPNEHFHFHVIFIYDRLSVPFIILTYVLCGTIGIFTSRYLHRDPGFRRFCVFFSFFVLGMVVSSLAGSIEVLFLGWELVGLSSALLVAFFQQRINPVRNGLRVWSVYRIADAAFLVAALTMHHMTGAGDFTGLMGTEAWPQGVATVSPNQALFVGLLLLIAAAGKSALVPFSGWLPRAMEGPTPSSAVFYGALSVHLGAFLLMRVSPLLDQSPLLRTAVIVLGLITAVYASLTSRVQTDVKSALAFASLTQVAIIVVEIGVDLNYVALIHMIGHACLRTLQLLRAPTLLRDYDLLENAIGEHLSPGKTFGDRYFPDDWRKWAYLFATERGFLDASLNEIFVFPFRKAFRWCDDMERRWTDFLSGGTSRSALPPNGIVDDLAD